MNAKTTRVKFIIYMIMSLPHVPLFAQLTLYPGSLTIEGQTYNSGTQIFSYPATIISPGNPNNPVTISNTANVTYQSATEVILKNGFAAGGFTGNGQFLGKINRNLDMVLVTPDPATSIINGQVHVPKWEKLEIALKLPNEYQTAINNFFNHYWSNQVVSTTDLNPYAFDSLEVKFDIVKPDGVTHLIRYAFFMRPGKFSSSSDIALPSIDENTDLSQYPFRFRFAPDEISNGIPWTFSVTISNPQGLSGFPTYTYSGFQFYCDNPLPDNHGFLNVHAVNKRVFQFDDSTPFFAIGLNIADARHAFNNIGLDWRLFYKLDFDNYINSVEDLASAGGNYIRTFLFKSSFNPEWEHLGVYDYYTATPNTCPDNSGWDSQREGNRQAHAWMLDSLLDKCRSENVYIQLCIDPYPPIVGYQKFIWGDNCYVREFVYPTSTADANNDGYLDQPYNTQEYFLSLLTAMDPYNEGAMYYWKRKYKYIMSRWGYSVNIAAFETFNEIDQTLGYYERDLSLRMADNQKIPNGPNVPDYNNGSTCDMNQILYAEDPNLISVIEEYHDVIVPYAKEFDDHHMFSVSYTHYEDIYYNSLLGKSYISFSDVHAYAEEKDATTSRKAITDTVYSTFNKPFQFGENSTFAEVEVPATDPPPATTKKIGTADFYNNYSESFHMEIWSTSMNGSFSTGLSWFWQTVFWWTGGMPYDFKYGYSPTNQHLVNNGFGDVNQVTIDGVLNSYANSTIYHHYKPLFNFFQNIDLNQTYDSWIYTDDPNGIQAIYNISQSAGIPGYGWLHNYNSYWKTNWVLDETYNYFEDNTICAASTATSYILSGLIPGESYAVSYYPTRMSGQSLPGTFTGMASTCGNSGCLTVPVTFTLGCDTTNLDFAFIIYCTSCPAQRISGNSPKAVELDNEPHIGLHPNPSHANTLIFCNVSDSYKCKLMDSKGKVIEDFTFTGNSYTLIHDAVSPGIYILEVRSGNQTWYKKLIAE